MSGLTTGEINGPGRRLRAAHTLDAVPTPQAAAQVARLAATRTARPGRLAGSVRRAMTAGAAVAVLVALVALAALAGCQQTANLAQAEVIVEFQPQATQADHARVWNACHGIPEVSPEPLVTDSKYMSTLQNNVRYRVDNATNQQLQQLYDCLRKDASVAGYRYFTPGDG